MRAVLMCFDAPMMSFGGVMVDAVGKTEPFPTLSMLTGLLGNALGYDHSEAEKLSALQNRIRYAVRRDRKGRNRVDYQTVDLGQPYLNDKHGWTTRGKVETRKGGIAVRYGIHQRYRHYLEGARFSLAVHLIDGEGPSCKEVVQALQKPARPLFLGRKCCPPATPIFCGESNTSLVAAVQRGNHGCDPTVRIWSTESIPNGVQIQISDSRDWMNRIHVGCRTMWMKDFSCFR